MTKLIYNNEEVDCYIQTNIDNIEVQLKSKKESKKFKYDCPLANKLAINLVIDFVFNKINNG